MTASFDPLSPALAALASQHCRAGAPRLADAEVARSLATLAGWTARDGRLEKSFRFANFHETVGFVNALAWIADREDHHPDLAVSYDRCVVAWSTHDAGGITANDVACAAKTDGLFA
jgi:4a-hydroxytetrahydrobiopterin dehydratase